MTQCCMGQYCPSVLLYMMHSNNNNNIHTYIVVLSDSIDIAIIAIAKLHWTLHDSRAVSNGNCIQPTPSLEFLGLILDIFD